MLGRIDSGSTELPFLSKLCTWCPPSPYMHISGNETVDEDLAVTACATVLVRPQLARWWSRALQSSKLLEGVDQNK